MADRYTKIVLTMIAVALVALVAQNATRPAKAHNDMSFSCYLNDDSVTVTALGDGVFSASVDNKNVTCSAY